jgi:hypothetical protein
VTAQVSRADRLPATADRRGVNSLATTWAQATKAAVLAVHDRKFGAKPGCLHALLQDADPLDKAEIYARIGLRLTYKPGTETAIAEVTSTAIDGVPNLRRRSIKNRTPTRTTACHQPPPDIKTIEAIGHHHLHGTGSVAQQIGGRLMSKMSAPKDSSRSSNASEPFSSMYSYSSERSEAPAARRRRGLPGAASAAGRPTGWGGEADVVHRV